MNDFRNNLTALLKLAIPLALTGVIQSATFFFETLFLAHLGKNVLAAGALVNWFLATIIVIFFGALSSVNVLVAHKHGAQDDKGITFVMRDGLMMAILFSILVAVLCWNMAPIFLFFGQTSDVALLAESYLHALTWGIIPNFLMIALLELVVGLGHARTVMVFSVFGVMLTIPFSYIFIFGKLGFPAFGIAGAGLGFSSGNVLIFLGLLIYMMSQKNYRKYFVSIGKFEKPVFLGELLHLGLPMGLMYCVEVGYFFTVTLILGTFNTVFLAANQIAMQYLGLLMSMIFSIAQAITVRMGHLLGAKEYRTAEQAALMGVSMSAILMLLTAPVFWFGSSWLIGIDFNIHDSKNQELVYYTMQLMMITPIFQILESMRISLFGVLRALKDTRFTLLISILSFWGLALPCGYFFAMRLHLNVAGFWWGMIVGVTFSLILLFLRFKMKIRHVLKNF